MAVSFIDEFKKARATGISPTKANAEAKAAIAKGTNNTSSGVPAAPTYVNNPDGTPVSGVTPVAPTNAVQEQVNVNNVNTGITTPLPTPTTTVKPTIDTTNSDIAATNVIAGATDSANIAASEISSQKKTTQELGQVDYSQAETKIANANANLAELKVNEAKDQVQKQANEEEYQANLRKNQEEEIAALKVQQASELVKNDAEAAELKSKQDKAERDAQTANEVAQMQSNVAFAKLGGSFSGAAINTAQKIFTDGAYNIATLKSSNAYDYASLKVKINSVAFEHTQAIGKLIQETAEKEFTSKERLRSFIADSQNTILAGKKESQTAIQDAITTYKTEQQTREDKLYSDMNAANKRLQTAAEDIQKQVVAQETTAKAKIDMLINNGQWNSLSPAQKIQYEAQAGVPSGTTANTIVAKTTQLLTDGVKALAGKSVVIPNDVLASMNIEVQRSLSLNIPLPTAIQMALTKYQSKIPGVKQAIDAANETSRLEVVKIQSEIDKNNAAALKDIEDRSGKASIANASKSGSGGSGGASSGKRYPAVTEYGEGLIDKGGVPYTLDGKVYEGALVPIKGLSEGTIFDPEQKSSYKPKPVTPTNSSKSDGSSLLNTGGNILKSIFL